MVICSGPSTSLVSLAVDGAGVREGVVRSASFSSSSSLTSSAVSSLMYISHPRSDSAGLKSSHWSSRCDQRVSIQQRWL